MKTGVVVGILGLLVGGGLLAYGMSKEKDKNCRMTAKEIDYALKQGLATQNPQVMMALANSFRQAGCESAARTAEGAAQSLATRGWA